MVGAAAGSSVPGDEANLVRRALAAVGRTAQVRLEKRIPVGAGLGGGSADAAAVLRWAGVSDPAVASALGADVPFCVVGGRALVTGIGEVVQPMEFEDRAFVLLTPPFGVSTAVVYRVWDELGGPAADGPNDLEAPALAVEPRLARWRDALGDLTGRVPVLAGSGSTWFVEGSAAEVGVPAGTAVGVDGAVARIVEVRTDRPSAMDV
jgi:4-diphosphocytidyl-2-C-methyl-D-erythritol kinase